MALAMFGVGAGLVAALGLTRLMRGLLFGIDALDLVSFGTTAGLLAVVAALASYMPARRASRTDPLVSLRSE
jgi:putative ABC transport system permease protein